MSYNFLNEAENIRVSHLCTFDTNIGFESNFNNNGNVDGWDDFRRIHTYSVWAGFLFGTIWAPEAYIEKKPIVPVDARDYYFVKISMKLCPFEGSFPIVGRLMWVTHSYPSWDSDKTFDFLVSPDGKWHTYVLNMSELYSWQGDISGLRIYPAFDGVDGDEFFIKSIKVTSTATFSCRNPSCSYYPNYSHPCAGIGTRGYCKSSSVNSKYYNIVKDVNDELAININDYGDELVKLDVVSNITGRDLARELTKQISKLDIGGYTESEVVYTDGAFKIYSGTYATDSSVRVKNNSLAVTLGFFDDEDTNLSSTGLGSYPVDGFQPASSFKIKSFQLLGLFDNQESTSLKFDPLMYNVEGGRRDWVENGTAHSGLIVDANPTHPDEARKIYTRIGNANKTLIDFNHPFNASGRIKKVYLSGTIIDEEGDERSNCKIKIFRPRKNGELREVTFITIPARDSNKTYSITQESIVVDCDIWVNKGDLLGVYNADIFVGKSCTGELDALYYHVSGDKSGEFDPGVLNGDGSAGIFIYARSEDIQKKLLIDIDLGHRINVKDITIKGKAESQKLEYNIARCLDINWQVDLFGGTHTTGYWDVWNAWGVSFTPSNIAYGINCLTDGVCSVENGLAGNYGESNGSSVISDPNYFFVNGDEEWVGIKLHVGTYKADQYVKDFEDDPIAFTMLFPYNKAKIIYKSKIYFKERWNFREFALSTYTGPDAPCGNADDTHFMLIPKYSSVALDGIKYYKGIDAYEMVDKFLFVNPTGAEANIVDDTITNYDAWAQGQNCTWNIIEHEFDSIECKGFRIYITKHLSTKINEMELYCVRDDIGSNISGGISIITSKYQEQWLPVSLVESEDIVEGFVGDTVRYFNIEIEPILGLELFGITINVSRDSVYVGDKGCDYDLLLDDCKTEVINKSKRIDIKNVYGKPYNLSVDIAKDEEADKGLIFWSKMCDKDSISSPEVGPGAYYTKEENYPLVVQNKNCAINCSCYGLKNLIDGKKSYYSTYGVSWSEHGVLEHGTSVNVSNAPLIYMSVVNLPILYRNKYWKIGFLCEDQNMQIREMEVFCEDQKYDYTPYFDNLPYENGPISGDAPHLINESPTGSYYTILGGNRIGFELAGLKKVDKIVLYHTLKGDYSNTVCGIDRYTKLCIPGGHIDTAQDCYDYSYSEHVINYVGSGVCTSKNDPKIGDTCISFDGNSYLTVPYSDDFNFSNKRFTLDFWVKFNSLPQSINHCLNVLPTGPSKSDGLDKVTDGSRSIYYDPEETPWSWVQVVWGTVKPISAVYMKVFMQDQFKKYGLKEDGSWEEYSGGGGSPDYLDGTSRFSTPKQWKGIAYWTQSTSNYIYEMSAFEYDPDTECVLIKNWEGAISSSSSNKKAFVLVVREEGEVCQLQFWYNIGIVLDYSWSPDLNRWYHIVLCRGPYNMGTGEFCCYIDGSRVYGSSGGTVNYVPGYQDIVIGEDLDGYMDEIRISRGDDDDLVYGQGKGGGRYACGGSFTPMTKSYERFYTMSLYVSDDNIYFGKYCDVDLKYDNSYSYYFPENKWDTTFNSYFAVDLGRRYKLYIVRNYGGSNLLSCSTTNNTVYSKDEVSDIDSVTFNDDYTDARWVKFKLASGSSKYVRKLGIYPDITNYTAPGGGYNHEWDLLGSSVTSYGIGKNVALNTTVSGSSTFGKMYLGKITDGIIGDKFSDAWGSDTNSTQWVRICFDQVYSIYRVKMYHGYNEDDSDYIIKDYTIQVSIDDSSYTTIFDITGNSDLVRTHDLSSPVSAKFVKINITNYNSKPIYLPTEDGYDWFDGAVLREIEVNEYYGFGVISSEDYPIISLNLGDQFYLTGHELVGVDVEDTSIDWSNYNSNFCYSDSVFSEPKKISFSNWGDSLGYKQWVAIKRDTATGYNDGPDYLKHAKIICNEKKDPCEYAQWWNSSISTLTSDHMVVKDAIRSLKIEYPTSSGIDDVYFIEDVGFGVDSNAAWRDGISFWWCISDIDKLDSDYGYFYFSGSNDGNPVEYRWSLNTLTKSNGWNNIFLSFRTADIEYTLSNVGGDDVRIAKNISWNKIGLKFRGKGLSFTINIDKLKILRNEFFDYSRYGQGLYLTGRDHLTCPIGKFDMSKGTIELFFKPDYNTMGIDTHNKFYYRPLFHFTNNMNTIFGATVSFYGMEIYAGNINEELRIFSIKGSPYWEINSLVHVAFIYSNDGSAISNNGDTIRLYINNLLIASAKDTWSVSDSKMFKFILGGQCIQAIKGAFDSSSFDAVVSNLKFYNYCKIDFSNSLNYEGEVAETTLIKPSNFIEISGDNKVTFLKVGDPNLPLVFKDVAPNQVVPIYIRATIPKGLVGVENRAAQVKILWCVGV